MYKNINTTKFVIATLIIGMAIMISCREKNYNTIEGSLKDAVTGEAVSNAKVEFFVTEISSGNFNSSFNKILEAYTDSEGKFNLKFESKSFVKFKITYSKDLYYSVSNIFEPKDVTYNYIINDLIPYQSFIKIRILNTYPSEANDSFSFRIEGINEVCESCFGNSKHIFAGANVDTTILCPVVGGENVRLIYSSIHNGATNYNEEIIYCTPGDTVNFDCIY